MNESPTYEELLTKLQKTEKVLAEYVAAINTLDSYFEYRCNSERDRHEVYKTLCNLTGKVGEIYATYSL